MEVSRSMLRKIFNEIIMANTKRKLLRLAPYLFLLGLFVIFFYPIFFGKIPLPFDALVGAYYPWHDYKWGYLVGVPFKNIALSDVFSQLYPWRILSIEAFRHGQWPLWNPYSLSGTPLLANWQSAPFYPLNLLLLALGDVWGWTLLIVSQPVLSALFMYMYLKQIGVRVLGRLIGAVTFTFSGFMITFMQYATIGQIMLWLPLQLYLIEKFVRTNKYRYLSLYSLSFFPVLTGGSFQPAFYALGVSFSYALIRIFLVFRKNFHLLLLLLIFIVLGISTAAIQLVPTLELYKYSIRLFDINIVGYQYGILPLRNIITFLSPDFFGNPATNNYFGLLQYQETSGYFSVVALILVILAILRFRKNIYFSYFTALFFLSLVFAFNNPLSRLVYQLNVPGLSSGYASRLLMLTSFSASVLAALGSGAIVYKKVLKINGVLLFIMITLFSIIVYGSNFSSNKFSVIYSFFNIIEQEHLRIAMRNMILPMGISSIYFAAVILLRHTRKYRKNFRRLVRHNNNVFLVITLVLISIDLIRFGLKFTPFSPVEMTNLSTPVIEYLKKNTGYHRIEREWGPVLPPNTWIYSRLSSPSGYDPLALLSYAMWYRMCQGSQPLGQADSLSNKFTRYLEENKYDSPCLDIFGVKYLVAIKRNKQDSYDTNGVYFNQLIPLEKFKEVFSDGTTAVLENTSVLPRVILYDRYFIEPKASDAQQKIYWDLDFRKDIVINREPLFSDHAVSNADTADIAKYLPNEVTVRTNTHHAAFLLLTDTYYPGWKVFLDNIESPLIIADGIYKGVEVPEGKHNIIFKYHPSSFNIGMVSSIVACLTLLLLILYEKRHE